MQLKISELREDLTQLGLPALGNKTELRGKLLLHITKDMKGMLYLTVNCCSCARVASCAHVIHSVYRMPSERVARAAYSPAVPHIRCKGGVAATAGAGTGFQ